MIHVLGWYVRNGALSSGEHGLVYVSWTVVEVRIEFLQLYPTHANQCPLFGGKWVIPANTHTGIAVKNSVNVFLAIEHKTTTNIPFTTIAIKSKYSVRSNHVHNNRNQAQIFCSDHLLLVCNWRCRPRGRIQRPRYWLCTKSLNIFDLVHNATHPRYLRSEYLRTKSAGIAFVCPSPINTLTVVIFVVLITWLATFAT